MNLTEAQIAAIVENVINRLSTEGAFEKAAEGGTAAGDGVFSDIESALRAAELAQRELDAQTLDMRRKAIAVLRRTVEENVQTLSRMAIEETGIGRYEDKIKKNLCVAQLTPGTEDLQPIAFTGDHGLTLIERAPYGVIGSITPCTNPSETIICNAIGMIAGGNSVVFNPHPGAKETSAYTIRLLNKAIVAVGGPRNLLCSIADPTQETAQEMMKHPKVKLLVVTGGPGVVKAAMNSGKKAICAGPGNPPVVVDETADIAKAGKDIVAGASLDNNIICIDEKEAIVVDSVADALKSEMKKHGVHELTGRDIGRITDLVIKERHPAPHESVANKKWVGKDAAVILKELGISAPPDLRLILVEVERDHPLLWTEQLMPVFPLTRVRSSDEGIDLAVEMEHGFRHTASMFSRNIEKLSRMARMINCSIFVKNGPNYAGLGLGGEGYTSFSIASPTGEGLTSAKDFTRVRRCTLVDYFRIV
ncbi:MAG: aldehyde dehydrogenase EutE [Candidatus Aureabacteria bacterium]|nr:aldehyde dehydrogenase EutE [Candidatus Auribacterota bacterium]